MQKRLLWLVMGISGAAGLFTLCSIARKPQEPSPQVVAPRPDVPVPVPETSTPPAVTPSSPEAATFPQDIWLPSHDLRDHLTAATGGDTDAAGGTPYFIRHEAGFLTLDRATGKVLSRWPLPDSGGHQWGVSGSPRRVGKFVVVSTLAGGVLAFER
jgi:hypothetical protein